MRPPLLARSGTKSVPLSPQPIHHRDRSLNAGPDVIIQALSGRIRLLGGGGGFHSIFQHLRLCGIHFGLISFHLNSHQ